MFEQILRHKAVCPSRRSLASKLHSEPFPPKDLQNEILHSQNAGPTLSLGRLTRCLGAGNQNSISQESDVAASR